MAACVNLRFWNSGAARAGFPMGEPIGKPALAGFLSLNGRLIFTDKFYPVAARGQLVGNIKNG